MTVRKLAAVAALAFLLTGSVASAAELHAEAARVRVTSVHPMPAKRSASKAPKKAPAIKRSRLHDRSPDDLELPQLG